MTRNIPIKPDPVVTSENKCGFCTNSKCCTYFTEQLDTPRSKHDFEHMLWQISHANTQIYKDEKDWFLLINNPCTHLLPPDGRCAIYDVRPAVCRDYDNDYCEFDASAEGGFDLFFADYAALLTYCKQRFKHWP